MEEIPVFPNSKIQVDGPNGLIISTVFNEKNILRRITENITKDVERMKFALTCKYFYTFMFCKNLRKINLPKKRFHLNVSFLNAMDIPQSSPYYGTVETKNVIQFDTSGACTYVWNYNHIIFDTCSKNYGSIYLPPYFKELNYWITLHSQLITDVRIDYDVGCKSLFYNEIAYIIFEKLTNLKKISMSSSVFYVLATSFFDKLQSLTRDKKNVIIEISASKRDNGGITKKLKDLDKWLTPEHHVELIPKVVWSCSTLAFGCPLNNISSYKYFRKIQNVSTFDLQMYFSDQKELEEIFVFCDSRIWFSKYNSTNSQEYFKKVSRFTFSCINSDHYGCGLGILSWFPLENNGYQNFSLKELSFTDNNRFVFQLNPESLNMLSKTFPNIRLLTIPTSDVSPTLKTLFCKFYHLRDVLLWNVSLKQMDEFIEFASTFPMDTYFIQSLCFISKKNGYLLNVKNAIEIQKRFKYFEVDSQPIQISEGKFVVDGVLDFMLKGKYSPFENKHVLSKVFISKSLSALEKFEGIISPKFN
uniref:F-box domain-containing protein n=1 Tax=Strongyloides stercoralis TaxID=6248 RepID=A0A0K0DSP7_STRER